MKSSVLSHVQSAIDCLTDEGLLLTDEAIETTLIMPMGELKERMTRTKARLKAVRVNLADAKAHVAQNAELVEQLVKMIEHDQRLRDAPVPSVLN